MWILYLYHADLRTLSPPPLVIILLFLPIATKNDRPWYVFPINLDIPLLSVSLTNHDPKSYIGDAIPQPEVFVIPPR